MLGSQVLGQSWGNPQVLPIFLKTWEKLGRNSGESWEAGKAGHIGCHRLFSASSIILGGSYSVNDCPAVLGQGMERQSISARLFYLPGRDGVCFSQVFGDAVPCPSQLLKTWGMPYFGAFRVFRDGWRHGFPQVFPGFVKVGKNLGKLGGSVVEV